MLDEKKILDMLANHEKRIEKLEGKKQAAGKKITSDEEEKKSLQDIIIELRNSSFFKEPKIIEEVHQEVQKVYPCMRARITTELIRLSKKKMLRIAQKKIEDKLIKAYVW